MNSLTSVSKDHLESLLNNAEQKSAVFWNKEMVISYKLASGFTILGRAACVDPANFSYEKGVELCFADAVSQLWALEGYVLQLKLAGLIGNEWQPIETAPKDERIILFRPDSYDWAQIIIGKFDDDKYAKKPRPYWSHERQKVTGIQEAREHQPTHWKPLPVKPDQGESDRL